jgi:adenosylmethionine-8-amino-7-oxononanoate aminotransferase
LDEIEAGAFANVQAVAPAFQAALCAMGDHPMVGEARGVGLMGALEMVADKAAKTPWPSHLDVPERVARQALKNGLICRPLGQAIVLAPPFIISRDEIGDLFAVLGRTLDEVYAGLPRP